MAFLLLSKTPSEEIGNSVGKSIVSNRFFRFLVVGGINTVFSYSLYAFLLFIGLHYLLAAIISFIISVLFNFETTGRLVFQKNDRRLLLKFIFSYVIILAISLFSLNMLVMLGISPYLAGLLNVFPVAIISFLIQRTFVFR
jgi:putative flippase GtrA